MPVCRVSLATVAILVPPGIETCLLPGPFDWSPKPPSLTSTTVSSDGELESEVDELREVTDEDRAAAADLKAQANKAFATKDFSRSIDLYTEAIARNPHDATFWNNRAMSKGKLEEHGAAISDATKAIGINPKYAKAYYRRGVSALAIMRPKDAVADFKKALEIEPSNRTVHEQLSATVKLVRRIEFEKVSDGCPRGRAPCSGVITSGVTSSTRSCSNSRVPGY